MRALIVTSDGGFGGEHSVLSFYSALVLLGLEFPMELIHRTSPTWRFARRRHLYLAKRKAASARDRWRRFIRKWEIEEGPRAVLIPIEQSHPISFEDAEFLRSHGVRLREHPFTSGCQTS